MIFCGIYNFKYILQYYKKKTNKQTNNIQLLTLVAYE